jgi:hypothetical protein
MPLSHLEHFLLQTADIKAARDWIVNLPGLKEGCAPDFEPELIAAGPAA